MSQSLYRSIIMLFLYILLDIVAALGYEISLPDKDMNKIDYDVAPLYQSIIIGDIADVMQDMDKIMVPQFGELFHNTASDENIEELLSEYQYFLDKAHKQRKMYMDKMNDKNKSPNDIPLLEPSKKYRNKISNYYTPSNEMIDLKPYSYAYAVPNLVDLYMPMNNVPLKAETTTLEPTILSYNQESAKLPQSQEIQYNEITKPLRNCQDPFNCICNTNLDSQKCQQNYKLLKKEYNNLQKYLPCLFDTSNKNTNQRKGYFDNTLNNVINVHMKIDMQIPTNIEANLDCPECGVRQTLDDNNIIPAIVNLPFPYLNFPTSYDDRELSNSKIKENYNTVHKSVHKRKRNRQNNKRHHKKLVAIRHFVHEQKLQSGEKNVSDNIHNNENEIHFEFTTEENNITTAVNNDNNATNDMPRELSLTVNVTFNSENETADYQKGKYNYDETTESDLKTATEEIVNPMKSRYKRDTVATPASVNETKVQSNVSMNNKSESQNVTKSKDATNDEELLFWSDIQTNISTSDSNNITKKKENDNNIIVANIHLALSNNNNSKSFNEIVTENINWSNIEQVSSLFSSFIGKYFNGVVTFCSPDFCYSTKCHEKSCVRKICKSEDRRNQKGHCHKANIIENVKVMDLKIDPAEIPLDMINLFEDKLLGNAYGKGTLCLSTKCTTFAIAKKTFVTVKCMTKTLNAGGHCRMKKDEKDPKV